MSRGAKREPGWAKRLGLKSMPFGQQCFFFRREGSETVFLFANAVYDLSRLFDVEGQFFGVEGSQGAGFLKGDASGVHELRHSAVEFWDRFNETRRTGPATHVLGPLLGLQRPRVPHLRPAG